MNLGTPQGFKAKSVLNEVSKIVSTSIISRLNLNQYNFQNPASLYKATEINRLGILNKIKSYQFFLGAKLFFKSCFLDKCHEVQFCKQAIAELDNWWELSVVKVVSYLEEEKTQIKELVN